MGRNNCPVTKSKRSNKGMPKSVSASHAPSESEQKATELLKAKTVKCQVKSKTVRKGRTELNMEIRLKNDNTEFINELTDLKGVESAVLVSYNGDYMG